MKRFWVIAAFAATTGGCLMPRSAGFGQTAAGLAPGAAEIGVSPGVVHHTLTTTFQAPDDSRTTNVTTAIAAPVLEGNVQYGLTGALGLNVHLSAAGIQPGVKIALLKGPVAVALLPAVAIGYEGVAARSTSNSGGTPTKSILFAQGTVSALAGLKAIISHSSGAYLGLGYDFQYLVTTSPSKTDLGPTTSISTWHHLGIAAGFELRVGVLRIRPEFVLQYSPFMTGSATVNGAMQDNATSKLLYLYPNFTVALPSPP